MKKYLLMFALLLSAAPLSAQGPAYPAYGGQGQAAHDPTGLMEPAQVLRKGIETLTGYLDGRQDNVSAQQLQQFLEQAIVPYFDFERMAWWSAGALNRHMTPTQRQQLSFLLKQRFMSAMTEQLVGYRNAQLVYLPPRGNPLQGDVTLGVRVFAADATPVQLDFRLYRGQAGWKVYDVMANGLSAVSHYRSEFAQMARVYGVEGLLSQLSR